MPDQLAAAREALATGDPGAVTLLKLAVQSDPRSGEAWYLLGQALTDLDQRSECLRRASNLGYIPPSFPNTGMTHQLDAPAVTVPNEPAAAYAASLPSPYPPLLPTAAAGSGPASLRDEPLRPPALPAGGAYVYTVPDAAPEHGIALGYAGFWLRFVASIIDGIILAVILSILNGIVVRSLGSSLRFNTTDPASALTGSMLTGILFFVLLSQVLQWLYYAVWESSSRRATPGKMILSLRVTDVDGRRISFGRASLRYWSKILSVAVFLIGYIMAAFTERKQALHDIIANCVVVRVR
ncbi:MAG: hypothetical protein NVS2B7_25720 [Herpetosiphon sp.]